VTPAERLIAAADLLDKRAGQATPGKWKLWGMQVRADIDGTSKLDTSLPVARTSHEAGLRTFNATYIATMHPEVGKALADWLRSEAFAVRGGEGRGFDGADLYRANPRALALADLLLAGAA
jgi:hypothetical protein